MKKTNVKRISAIILTVALLFTTVFSTTILVSAASFSPRYEAPSYDNQYYYSSKNIFYSAGYGMPNCTAYAFGRAYEILGYEPNLSHGNAQDWYGYNLNGGYYNYGSTPKVGAIACWSHDSSGHVAVVESIDGNTVTYSNSAWSGSNFYLTYGNVSDPGSGGNSWWNFQGYIYILDSDSGSEPSNGGNTSAEPLPTDNYSLGTYRVNVSSTLNMRNGAGTSYNTVASVPNETELVVTDISSDSSYVWGYANYNGTEGWIALSYCDYVSSSAEEPTEKTEPVEDTTEATEPAEETTEVTKPDDSDEIQDDPEEKTTEATEPETTEPTTEAHDYVLYIANENSEETIAYPLSDLYQTASVTLDAGNYLIYMSEDGNTISGTYELVLTAKNEVSVKYVNPDYFLIICNEVEASEPNNDDATSTPDEIEETPQETTSATVIKDTKQSVSKSSTSDTPSNNAVTAENTNGAIQTGQDIQVEAAMILAFSLASLALLWFKRKKLM